MKMDYHLHSNYSGDGKSTMEELCAAAVRKGISHIAITDHHDMGNPRFEISNFSRYLGDIDRCRAIFPELTIARGLELDYRPETWERMSDLHARLNLDFALLSLHFIDGVDTYYSEYYEGLTQRQAYEKYLTALADMIRRVEGHYVVGHITYVSKFAPFADPTLRYAEYADALDEVLRLIVSKGFGLEVNASGIKNNAGTLPNQGILRRYRELGGEILTVGSDAHSDEALGLYLDEAVAEAQAAGFRYLATYHQMAPQFEKIQ